MTQRSMAERRGFMEPGLQEEARGETGRVATKDSLGANPRAQVGCGKCGKCAMERRWPICRR